MRAWFRSRYLDLLASIYIYNEHRGYTAIDDLLAAVRERWPDDHALIARIEKHRVDERKHYVMFRRWFERRGIMPLAVDSACGHIDRFVGIMFGSSIDALDKQKIVGNDRLFARLCALAVAHPHGRVAVRVQGARPAQQPQTPALVAKWRRAKHLD